MGFVKRHWPTLCALAGNLPSLWRGLVWLFDWEERIESAAAKLHELGGLGGVIEFLLNPPPWLIWVTLPAGLLLILWDSKRPAAAAGEAEDKQIIATVTPPDLPLQPDISASDAYFRVLAGSQWREQQLKKTTNTKDLRPDWLEFRLDKEIHKGLRNSQLVAWGEECLPGSGFVTTPEKPIPPDAWDKIEIAFESNPNLPRTAAYFKGPTTFQKGRSAWLGVQFNQGQFFGLFPLGSQEQDFKPIWEAIAHVAHRIGDVDVKGYWPKARLAVRQRAFDNELKIRGRRSENLMAAGLSWSEVETDIPCSYWETADIHVTATAQEPGNAPQTFPHRYSGGRFGSADIYLYAWLRVDWAEVIKWWP